MITRVGILLNRYMDSYFQIENLLGRQRTERMAQVKICNSYLFKQSVGNCVSPFQKIKNSEKNRNYSSKYIVRQQKFGLRDDRLKF